MIHISICSFNNKSLLEDIENVISLADNKEDLRFYVSYQQPRIIKKFPSNVYWSQHIQWDSPQAVYMNLQENLDEITEYNDEDLFILLNPSCQVDPGWDTKIKDIFHELEPLNNNFVVSGTHEINIMPIGRVNGFIKKSLEKKSTKNFVVDLNCIISRIKTIKAMGFPSYLKYYGITEEISIRLASLNYPIYAIKELPIQHTNTDEYLSIDYLPFSLYHNFNEIVDLAIHGKNSFYKIDSAARPSKKFFELVYLLNKNKIPYEVNDVPYDPYKVKPNWEVYHNKTWEI